MNGISLSAAAWLSEVLMALSSSLTSRRRFCAALRARILENGSSSSSPLTTSSLGESTRSFSEVLRGKIGLGALEAVKNGLHGALGSVFERTGFASARGCCSELSALSGRRASLYLEDHRGRLSRSSSSESGVGSRLNLTIDSWPFRSCIPMSLLCLFTRVSGLRGRLGLLEGLVSMSRKLEPGRVPVMEVNGTACFRGLSINPRRDVAGRGDSEWSLAPRLPKVLAMPFRCLTAVSSAA